MPSIDSFKRFRLQDIPVDRLHIDSVDSLESSEDLVYLYETLNRFKDYNGINPVLTAFSVVANPDFEKIEAMGRREYHYELVTNTYARNHHTTGTYALIIEGIKNRLYIPQFHGREHIHVIRWIEAINSGSLKEEIAFKERAIISTMHTKEVNPFRRNYFAAFDSYNSLEIKMINNILREGLDIFEDLFGYRSFSFAAQGSIWSDEILETLWDSGVKLIGGQQLVPYPDDKYKLVNHLWGRKNRYGQIYWRRNCTFEPARDQNYDWVSRCLNEIEIAFRWGKPAIISSHRENFIGSIFPENRDRSLKKLRVLLAEVLKRWPDIEFMSTEQIGVLMLESLKSKKFEGYA